jgi:ribonuclease VapC
MTAAVLDSSVLISILNQEKGWQESEAYLNQGIISAVNMAEVASYLGRKVSSLETINQVLSSFMIHVIPYDGANAAQTGLLNNQGMKYGLSLGDRVCFTLAQERQLPVVTTDRIWQEFGQIIGVDVILMR